MKQYEQSKIDLHTHEGIVNGKSYNKSKYMKRYITTVFYYDPSHISENLLYYLIDVIVLF